MIRYDVSFSDFESFVCCTRINCVCVCKCVCVCVCVYLCSREKLCACTCTCLLICVCYSLCAVACVGYSLWVMVCVRYGVFLNACVIYPRVVLCVTNQIEENESSPHQYIPSSNVSQYPVVLLCIVLNCTVFFQCHVWWSNMVQHFDKKNYVVDIDGN